MSAWRARKLTQKGYASNSPQQPELGVVAMAKVKYQAHHRPAFNVLF